MRRAFLRSSSLSTAIRNARLNDQVLDLGPDKVGTRFEYEQADDDDKEIPDKARPFL